MRFIVTVLMATAISFASAQTFSVRVGANNSTQLWKTGSQTANPKWRFGPHINVAVTNSLTKKIATQLELGYTQIGHGGYDNPNSVPDIPEAREDFALAGLMFKYHFSESFNIHAGPQLGWFIGNKQNLGVIDFSAAAGVEGYVTKHIGFGLRYCHGISDLNSDQLVSQKSRFFQLSMIVRFRSEQLDELHY